VTRANYKRSYIGPGREKAGEEEGRSGTQRYDLPLHTTPQQHSRGAERSDDVRPGSRSEIRSPSWPVTRASRRRKLRHRFHGAFRVVVHRGRIHLCVCAAVTTLSGPFPPELADHDESSTLSRSSSRRASPSLPPQPCPSTPTRRPFCRFEHRRVPRPVRSNIISRGRRVALRDTGLAPKARRVSVGLANDQRKKSPKLFPFPPETTALRYCVFKMSARRRRCVVVVVVVVIVAEADDVTRSGVT